MSGSAQEVDAGIHQYKAGTAIPAAKNGLGSDPGKITKRHWNYWEIIEYSIEYSNEIITGIHWNPLEYIGILVSSQMKTGIDLLWRFHPSSPEALWAAVTKAE